MEYTNNLNSCTVLLNNYSDISLWQPCPAILDFVRQIFRNLYLYHAYPCLYWARSDFPSCLTVPGLQQYALQMPPLQCRFDLLGTLLLGQVHPHLQGRPGGNGQIWLVGMVPWPQRNEPSVSQKLWWWVNRVKEKCWYSVITDSQWS